VSAHGKTAVAGPSDPVFHGDAVRWNPPDLLIAALSACHQLWHLHLEFAHCFREATMKQPAFAIGLIMLSVTAATQAKR